MNKILIIIKWGEKSLLIVESEQINEDKKKQGKNFVILKIGNQAVHSAVYQFITHVLTWSND